MQQNNKVAAIIIAYNGARHLANAINSIKQSGLSDIYVYDNNSTDQSAQIAECSGCKVMKGKRNLGYGSAINIIIDAIKSKFDHFLILNQDAILIGDCVVKLLEEIENCTVCYPFMTEKEDIEIGNLPIAFSTQYGWLLYEQLSARVVETNFFHGGCFLLNFNRYKEISNGRKLFDEALFMYHEDLEASLYIWNNNGSIRYVSDAICHHPDDRPKPLAIEYGMSNYFYVLKRYGLHRKIFTYRPYIHFVMKTIVKHYINREWLRHDQVYFLLIKGIAFGICKMVVKRTNYHLTKKYNFNKKICANLSYFSQNLIMHS